MSDRTPIREAINSYASADRDTRKVLRELDEDTLFEK